MPTRTLHVQLDRLAGLLLPPEEPQVCTIIVCHDHPRVVHSTGEVEPLESYVAALQRAKNWIPCAHEA
jgi:hypothetical protein